jgi:hypothetical protein
MATVSDRFYTDLPVQRLDISELFDQEQFFIPVPSDWHVIITDIKGSTLAVQQGMHHQVNVVATGSVVAVLNIVFGSDISIPFFFGGDGATFIVPGSLISEVIRTLSIFSEHMFERLKLELRVGSVPVKAIYAAGHQLRLLKFPSSSVFAIPVVLGHGLVYAESLIKGESYFFRATTKIGRMPDLRGMRCRWDNIVPSGERKEIISLLVTARNPDDQAKTLGAVLAGLANIYGSLADRQPIVQHELKIKSKPGRLGTEASVKTKWGFPVVLFAVSIRALFHHIFLRTRKGRRYLEKLMAKLDTLVLDGRINTVICGTTSQRIALQQLLNELEEAGKIAYGLHVSPASVMSCYVRDHQDAHIHFVDGSEGGYTQASKILKEKLQSFHSSKREIA